MFIMDQQRKEREAELGRGKKLTESDTTKSL